MNTRVLAAAALVVLAGCGGGGGSAAPSVPSGIAPTTAPTNTPITGVQSATLTLTFPVHAQTAASRKSVSAKRSPKYVDGSNTDILVTTINSVNGQPLPNGTSYASTTTGLFNGGNCTTSGSGANLTETCTVSIPAPAGSVNYTFTGEDNSGITLETVNTTQTITLATLNSFSVVLNGAPAGGAPVSLLSEPVAGTPETVAVPFNITDADGGIISGTFAPASGSVVLESTNSHIKLALTSTGTFGSSVTLTNSTDARNVYFSYDGTAISQSAPAQYELLVGITEVGHANIPTMNSSPVFAGLTTAGTGNGSAPGAVNYGAPTYIFDAAGQTQSSASASEAGFTPTAYGSGQLTIALANPQPTGAGSDNGDGTYNAGNCAAVVTALTIGAPDSSGNEAISATAGVAGICEAVVSDGLGDSSGFYISVTTASGSIDAKHRTTR